MKIVRHLLFLLFLTAFSPGEDGPQNVAQLFQTPGNLEIITSPEWVDVCILYPKKPWFSRKHPTNYREGKYEKLSLQEAALLSTKLNDEKTYDWSAAKACMPTYNARIRFHKADQVVAADFCFGCDIVIFRKNGKPFTGQNFDAASDDIFEVVHTHFPNNAVVTAVLEGKEADKKNRALIEELVRLEKEKKTKDQPTVLK